MKICDPAIGSGAFPMGLVNLLSKLYAALRLSTEAAEIKRHIMENSIYGVDIEKGAVDIARLRFWLAMIVEENEPMPLPNLHFKIMHGNSLIESYRGLDLSDLTQVNAQKSFWDSNNSERESLVSDLKRYYGESDHTERQRIFDSIIKNVRRQIHAKDENLSQKGLDPSDNSQFFLWHTWFTDVFEKGGFDIVIGNPPYGYIFKEASYRNQIIKRFHVAEYKVDAYSVFTELGYSLLQKGGVLTYITPYTFVSGVYFSKFREFLGQSNLSQFVLLGKKVFETAEVDTAIFLLRNSIINENVQFCDLRNSESENRLLDVNLFPIPYIDFFSKKDEVLLTASKEEINTYLKLYNVSESYLGDEIIFYHGVQTRGNGKALTQTKESTNSLPLIKGADFNRYKKPESSCFITFTKENIKSGGDIAFYNVEEKIVIRTTADRIVASIDREKYITLNSVNVAVAKKSTSNLPFILGIMNSKLMEFWYRMSVQETAKTFAEVKIVYLERMPICKATVSKRDKIASIVNDLLSCNNSNEHFQQKLELLIYKLYDLSYDELKIVDPETSITKEQYNNYE